MHKIQELLDRLRLNPVDNELRSEIRKLLRETIEDAQTSKLLKEHWSLLNTDLSENDLSRLDKILEEIHVKTNMKSPNNKKRYINRKKIIQIAATLLLPIAIYAGIHYFKKAGNNEHIVQITTEITYTKTKHFFLPDSTEVWLNSESQLNYPENFERQENRLVTLTGQAYFKVYHDAAHPFIVQTSQIDIRVLGTSFDVSAYPNEQTISSTLEEGSIALYNKTGNQLEKLVPGEQAVFNITNSTLVKNKIKTSDQTSWKVGKLVFRDTGITEVARKLERRFGYSISIDPELQRTNPTYTFTVQHESINEICRLIELSTNAKATIKDTHIFLEKIE
ncbi:FecR family protein [Maribellus maritimus]|uniref:FecR family protein n=1 Tax=Maribellus maritimus TaxID=2870838 RepID=UPI001EEB4914|nr:FecR family protein [Maribellus maritimus]MCG6191006.1 FecR domain-containing protein [Maribellus maritimus]